MKLQPISLEPLKNGHGRFEWTRGSRPALLAAPPFGLSCGQAICAALRLSGRPDGHTAIPRRRVQVYNFLLSFLLAGVVVPAGLLASPPRAEAPFAPQPPVVDGRLDDDAWQAAQPLVFPAGDGPTSTARFLWTKEGMYVAFRAEDSTPAYGHAAPGQPVHQGDSFEIFIDESGDHRQWYEIQADPAGQVFIKNYLTTAEPRLTKEGRLTPEFCQSEYWRYDWPLPENLHVASQRDKETGLWTLEMFLPAEFVNRRHGGAPLTSRTWRLQLVRHDWDKPLDAKERKCLFQYWAPILEGHPHMSPTRMGYLKLKMPKDR